jgi:hypothetical protein
MALDPTMGGTLKFASVTPIWSVRVPEGVSLGFHSFGVIHNGSREGRMCRNEAFTCLFHLRGRCFLPPDAPWLANFRSLRIHAVANANSGNLRVQPANCPRNDISTSIALRWPPGG